MSLNLFKANREDPTDPVGLLLDCHDRIRHFAGVGKKLAAAPDDTDAESIRLAAESLVRYFEKALPLHSEDEDISILPRLGRAGAQCDEARMLREHEELHGLIGKLVPMWKELAEAPGKLGKLREQLSAPTGQMALLFEEHLRYEDEQVFPKVRAALNESARRKIFEEMRARRA